MKVVIKPNGIKLQLTAAQVKVLRRRFNCYDRPVTYGAARLYWQGGGWYQIIVSLEDYDWANEMQMAKALLRKIRSMFAETINYDVVPAPFVDLPSTDVFAGKSLPAPKPVLVSDNANPITLTVGKDVVAQNRLAHLAKVVNSKFHRG